MKCKRCEEEINLVIFDMPNDDVCYGCLTPEERDNIIEKNIEKR